MRCKFNVAKFHQIVLRTRKSRPARGEKADAQRESSSAFQVLRHSSSLKSRCLPTFEFINKLLYHYKLSHWLLWLVHLTSNTVMLQIWNSREITLIFFPSTNVLCVLIHFSCIWLFATPWTVDCPWGSPDKNTGVGCHFHLQGIFPTQGLNSRL